MMEKRDRESKLVLIIEDESHIAEGLSLNLSLQGYDVCVARDGAKGLELWKDRAPDLIVLDLMLPEIDGMSVLQQIRLQDEKVPIMILSAKGEPSDRIEGLSLGVDDYLTKPFVLEEFLLRVERLLTRADWNHESASELAVPKRYSFGTNVVDFETSTAECKRGTIKLTEQEVRLLKLFIAHRGKTLTRKTILEIGWGYTGKVSTRTVDNFVVRLRKYFEQEPGRPRHFKSVRSVGYVFIPDPEA